MSDQPIRRALFNTPYNAPRLVSATPHNCVPDGNNRVNASCCISLDALCECAHVMGDHSIAHPHACCVCSNGRDGKGLCNRLRVTDDPEVQKQHEALVIAQVLLGAGS